MSNLSIPGSQGFWLCLIVSTVALFKWAAPDIVCTQTRFDVSRAKADHRSLATALESYFLEFNAYPAWTTDHSASAFSLSPTEDPPPANLPTFTRDIGPYQNTHTLTTPTSYISNYFTDPFTPESPLTYCYWNTTGSGENYTPYDGWILWSPGPDEDYDITLENVARAYNLTQRIPNEFLTNLTYDPTNGLESNGDVYRTKH